MFKWFRRRRVKVEIRCLHGVFIPASYKPWRNRPAAFACKKCAFRVVLTTHRGNPDW